MRSDQVRRLFLDYFVERDHLLVPSASLIPAGDPTLLFTSAGMVPFKPYFLGQARPPHRRLTSCQKCFRTTDIDSVGDYKHLTFFEMLGNFSIGDYFKEGAITYAWEFVTRHLNLPPERLWITIYLEDDEAFRLWNEKVGVPAERIYRYGKTDNWWGPPGAEGPCGPCSEIHYDFGPEVGCGAMARPDEAHLYEEREVGCHPNCDRCERFVELWNLVFMQFYQDPEGNLSPLPAPNIDTGMGLERATAIVQGVRTVYDTDLFRPLLERACDLCGRPYGRDPQDDYALRVVAEHSRSAVFLIADGVVPANEGRGYGLRRIIRRAIRFGRRLGLEGPFLGAMAEAVMEKMGPVYPELVQNREFVLRVLDLEERRFGQVFEQGLRLLEEEVLPRARREGRIAGEDLFRLYDTYGFPPELTEEMAREHGLTVDREGFERAMERQRERARQASAFAGGGQARILLYEALGVGGTRFLGYQTLTANTVVVALLVGDRPANRAEAGQEVEVVLRETPFYPEGGGQVGDQGEIRGPSGRMRVEDTQAPLEGLIVHRGRVVEGFLSVGDPVTAGVDAERRLDTARNHTGTHLLHSALRQVLGPHVRQSGSLVAPDRLRFDFTHMQALTPQELRAVEALVNEKVREDLPVVKEERAYLEAIQAGALAFFGDKYGERVRTVRIGGDGVPFSFEVCGGTHLERTGQIGLFLITSESSIGAGVRRIEAVTGRWAEAYVRERLGLLDALARKLEAPVPDLPARLDALLEDLDRARKEVQRLEREAARRSAEALLAQVQEVEGVRVLSARVSVSSVEAMREMGDHLRQRLGSGAVVLGAVLDGRPTLVAMLTPDLVERGLHAGVILKEASRAIEGGGGGRPEMAQAGGRRPEGLDSALRQAVEAVRRQVRRA